ncbi:helix-turn-helix domain-containing protein [Mesoflavibacter sp. CH_XMU1404-2]|uniref:helix-turn-helix domain-containing protein n=1 Tax=Mesoflavibacter sp. CH_XMU1404-2 TaxID=3107766 RepID=UPI00300B0CFD
MKFERIYCHRPNKLIGSFVEVHIEENDLPLTADLLPTAQSHIIYFFSDEEQEIRIKNKSFFNKGLVISGQSYRSYQFIPKKPVRAFVANFSATTLHKVSGKQMSSITDSHIPLSEFCNEFYQKIIPLFDPNKTAKEIALDFESLMYDLPKIDNKNVNYVDIAVDLIHQKKGRITVDEVLEFLTISQKNLEIQFKKVVGLTPLKYIKLYRFWHLMKAYESKKIDFNQALEYYNYYDLSHFNRDFKLFMKVKPSEYVKRDNTLIKNYLTI